MTSPVPVPDTTAGIPTLLGVPYDASSSFRRGAAAAPPLIREALHSPARNLWTERLADLGAPGALGDAGDIDLSVGADARETIEGAVRGFTQSRRRPIALGGDHSITYPILRALRPLHPDLTLLQFDAHPDLYDEFEGDRFSHACPFARILEERLTDRLVQVGIRTTTGHQRAQAVRFGVEVIDMEAWVSGQRPRVSGPVYISIDIDAIDPAYAPGVSHREPGGLTVRDIVGVLQELAVPIVGADVVELNPTQDPLGLTAPVCAKLVKELAGAMGAGS
ncbi:MAG: agmatinase [Gemmatimonadota bacterium]|nr:agmatinase [Gemmatimonadota bacterium]